MHGGEPGVSGGAHSPFPSAGHASSDPYPPITGSPLRNPEWPLGTWIEDDHGCPPRVPRTKVIHSNTTTPLTQTPPRSPHPPLKKRQPPVFFTTLFLIYLRGPTSHSLHITYPMSVLLYLPANLHLTKCTDCKLQDYRET